MLPHLQLLEMRLFVGDEAHLSGLNCAMFQSYRPPQEHSGPMNEKSAAAGVRDRGVAMTPGFERQQLG